jgi:uncharacterized damage-inducible protein DinB
VTTTDTQLRAQLAKVLDWKEAHAGYDKAVDGVPPAQRGAVPDGLPYSIWQLVEHLRIAQHDILDFCVNSGYEEKKWPDDYWPASPAPASAADWDQSIAGYRRDRERLKQLAGDESIDLFAKIPHGSGQTYVRELLLVADHNSYHVGQIVIVRRALGIWGS